MDYIDQCRNFISNHGSALGLAYKDKGAIDPVAVIGLGWTIYKDLKDIRGTRVEGLNALLETTRLASITDLEK